MKANKLRNQQVKGGDIWEGKGIKRKEQSTSERCKEDKTEKTITASKDLQQSRKKSDEDEEKKQKKEIKKKESKISERRRESTKKQKQNEETAKMTDEYLQYVHNLYLTSEQRKVEGS